MFPDSNISCLDISSLLHTPWSNHRKQLQSKIIIFLFSKFKKSEVNNLFQQNCFIVKMRTSTEILTTWFLLFNICVIYLLFYSHGITWLTFSGRFAHTLGGYRKTSLSGRRTMSSTLNRKSTQTTHPSVKGTQNGRSLLLFPELISDAFFCSCVADHVFKQFFPLPPTSGFVLVCFFSAQSAYFLSDQSLWFQ